MSIFMTPKKKPFFAATYLPKQSRQGRPGLIDICRQVKNLWSDQNEKVEASAASIAANLNRAFAYTAADAAGCRFAGSGLHADQKDPLIRSMADLNPRPNFRRRIGCFFCCAITIAAKNRRPWIWSKKR